MPTKKISEITESTQLDLKRELESDPGLAHLSSVQAIAQTGGRGRQGNPWISKRGNLYLSVLYRLADQDPSVTRNITWLPLWIGMRVRQALVTLGVPAADLQLKWPNDIYYRNRAKLGGILCEKLQTNVIVGIGLNIEHSPYAELQAEGKSVIALTEAGFTGENFTVDAVRDEILSTLASPFDLNALKTELTQSLIPRPGAEVHWIDYTLNGMHRSGVVTRLGGFGELHVMTEDGIAHLFSEEVSLKKIEAGTRT